MSIATEKAHASLLKVPGAQIYYEVEGSGPVLLMIPGGPTDAGIFGTLAAQLVDRYTVVRYDPRGNSRSVFDGPPLEQNLDVHGDDAVQLLAVFGTEPAYVLGSSGGAQIGLNLAARHPQSVRTLVAHEPPCVELLPDAAAHRAFNKDVLETYRSSGAGPAMQKFMTGAGLADDPPPQKRTPPTPEALEAFSRIQGNLDYFFAHGFEPLAFYVPDVAALRTGTPKIVIGIGETSAAQVAGRTAIALAGQLGVTSIIFPGGHGGYNDNPPAFAEKLDAVLRGTKASTN